MRPLFYYSFRFEPAQDISQMAQQQLCRVGTHEEERKADAAKAEGSVAPGHLKLGQRWESDISAAPNGDTSTLPVPKAKACPDRLRPLLPPRNFGAVISGQIYRSSMPEAPNFSFLAALKLKTILTLVSEWEPEYAAWIKEQNINHVVIPVPANKEVVQIEPATILRALAVVLDRSNYPLLIHCNKGKHRTGCVVGCLRKIQGESMTEVTNEDHAYADPKARRLDEVFIEDFDERTLLWLAQENGHLPVDEPGLESPALTTSLPVSRMRN